MDREPAGETTARLMASPGRCAIRSSASAIRYPPFAVGNPPFAVGYLRRVETRRWNFKKSAFADCAGAGDRRSVNLSALRT